MEETKFTESEKLNTFSNGRDSSKTTNDAHTSQGASSRPTKRTFDVIDL
jgi:hypothetical protein